MKLKKEYFFVLLISALLFIFGCAQNNAPNSIEKSNENGIAVEKNSMEKSENAEKEVMEKTISEPKLLAGASSKYYRFEKTHYEKSLAEGKVIFLDFHANWCPICRNEQPNIFAAFNELNNENVVGYQVHYNDDETNEDDEELAKKFGITYQHTKVILDKNGEVALKSLEVFSKDKVLNEINKINN